MHTTGGPRNWVSKLLSSDTVLVGNSALFGAVSAMCEQCNLSDHDCTLLPGVNGRMPDRVG